MPQYNCTISFGLSTRIGPEGVSFDRYGPSSSDISEYEDNSYFSEYEVECDGGEITCTVDAEDEDDCESKLREIVEDGTEVEDDNSFTWVVDGVDYGIEEVEWEPTVEEAVEVLAEWVANASDEDERVAKAASVVLDDHARLGRRVSDLETKVSEQGTKIDALARRLETLGFALEGDAPQS